MPHLHDMEEDMIKDSEERLKEKRERKMESAKWWTNYFEELPDALNPFYGMIVVLGIILVVIIAVVSILLLIKFGIWLFT